MSQQDLNSISSSANNYYLTTYTFDLTSTSTQQHINVHATSTPLADKKDSPLSPGLAKFIDTFRNGEMVLALEFQDKLIDLLTHLNNPTYRQDVAPELKRYFNTAASPMVLQAVHSGQQAQQSQVLRHMDSFRKSGGMASSRPSPDGAAGPSEGRKGLNGWMKGYGSNATKDPDSDFTGYDANVAGMVIGVEKAFGNSLIGVAGGSARTDVDTDEPGSSDVETYFGSLYGSYGADAWFIDSSLSYGQNKVESQRGSLMPAQAEYDAENVAVYIGGGYQFQVTDRLALTPELGGQLNYYHQDSFTETGILNNTYDSYDYWFFESTLGANAAMLFPAGDALLFLPELRLHWRHNFNTDPDRISYTTDGTGTGASAGIQSPEEDTFVIGAGLLTTVNERLDIDLRIDQQLADGWKSTTYSGNLKVHF